MFYPATFWHTPDWESSTPRHREGYLSDEVLYAGDFDEVNIHLFPRGRTLRVRSMDADTSTLRELGLRCAPGKAAYIFVHQSCRQEVESFHPTVFKFRSSGFVRVRRGEYVSRRPQRAISAETIPMSKAIEAWNIQACYVDDLDIVVERLRRESIYFDEQT